MIALILKFPKVIDWCRFCRTDVTVDDRVHQNAEFVLRPAASGVDVMLPLCDRTVWGQGQVALRRLNSLEWSKRRLWKAGEDSVAIVQPAGCEHCNELRHHVIVDLSADLFQASELIEAAGCNLWYMLLQWSSISILKWYRLCKFLVCNDANKKCATSSIVVRLNVKFLLV